MNIDQMLYNDTMFLVNSGWLDYRVFVKLANKIDLRQKDWDLFWKRLNNLRVENNVES